MPLADHIPISGDVTYRFGPDDVDVDQRTVRDRAHQRRVRWPHRLGRAVARSTFTSTSGDWQESDEVLAGILTDFGSRTGPVNFGGRGEFDGDMTGPIRRPRVGATFTGEDMRGLGHQLGRRRAHIVVENNYVTVGDGVDP